MKHDDTLILEKETYSVIGSIKGIGGCVLLQLVLMHWGLMARKVR